MIRLTPEQLATVKAILAQHVPHCEVRAFGSRVQGLLKPYSDLDLAIYGPEPLGLGTMGRLHEAFEDSDLPFRVDVLDAAIISPEFRGVIEPRAEVIQSAT